MNTYKILYLSYDGMTDPLGQSQVLPYLRGLSMYNFEIHLISFEKKERFVQNRHKIEQLLSGFAIKWYPLHYHQKPPVISTLYDLWKLNSKVKQLLKTQNISFIHCRSYIAALVGLKFKKELKIPFIFDMRGFWADERVDGKLWNLKNPLFKAIYTFFKHKEQAFLQQSAHIVSLTQNAKDEILSWQLSHVSADKISVIPCCADLEHFSQNNIDKMQLHSIKKKLGIKDDSFTISYIGSLGTWYMIDEMMSFFKILLQHIPQAFFLIISTDAPEIAYQAAEKLQIDTRKILVISASRQEVPYYIALSKCSVFFINSTFSKKASSPTKLAEILGMGVPVICNSGVGDVEQIVKNGEVGIVIDNFDNQSYTDAIKRFLAMPPLNPSNIALYASNYASLSDGINNYLRIYRQLSKG